MMRMASGPETAESANGGSLKTFHRETHFRTAGGLSVTDITDHVQEAVQESGVRDGGAASTPRTRPAPCG